MRTASERRRPGRPIHPIARSDLLSHAARAFAGSGFDGTSMSQVAEQTALSKASLFHHYPTKEALYVAVLERVVGDLGALVLAARMDEGPFAERLDRLGRLIIEYLAEHRDAARLLVRELLDRGPYLRQGGEAVVMGSFRVVAEFLAAGMDAGVFARRDPAHLAVSIIGLHLHYFAVSDLTSRFLGEDVGAPAARQRRVREALAQVRALCLAPAPPVGRPGAPRSTRSSPRPRPGGTVVRASHER